MLLTMPHAFSWLGFLPMATLVNLFSHRDSVYQSGQLLTDQINKIQTKGNNDWLTGLLKDWGTKGWLSPFVKTVLWALFLVFIVLVILSSFAQRMQKSMAEAFIPENKKGAAVETQGPAIEL